MKKWKIENGDNFYGEAIFYIAAYNCNRNYFTGKRNSKRTLSSMLAITNFLHNLPETPKEKIKNI